MNYRIRIAPSAEVSIRAQARHIAVHEKAPLNATRWMARVYAAADTLDTWPRRCALADENDARPYEVRKLNVAGYLLLFTIDESTKTVWVIGAHHGRMQPRPDDLPEASPGDDPS